MNYKFGYAKSLYQRGIHPRVLLGPGDLKTLKTRIRSGDGKKIMIALRRRVRTLVDAVLAADDLAALLAWKSRNWRDPGILVRFNLHEIAMVGVLDEDAAALEAVRHVFGIIAAPGNEATGSDQSAFAFDLVYHHLPEDTRRAYGAAMTDLIRRRLVEWRPKIYKSAAGNIPLGLSLAAFELLLAIKGDPGLPNLDAEQAALLSIFEAVLHVAINPDGYPEEDIGYGSDVASFLSVLGETLRRAGIYDPYVECPRYARFGRAMLHFVQPWGMHLSNTGDHGDDFGHREFVLPRLATETKDPTLLWLLGTLQCTFQNTRQKDAMPPFYEDVAVRRDFRTLTTAFSLLTLPDLSRAAVHPSKTKTPTQFRDRGRGIVSFRSGWNADDTLVVFDGSQRSAGGQGHFHHSCGHFSVSALGEYFAIDTGRYNMEQNCHNVVLIDGKSGRSTNGEWDYAKQHGLLIDYLPGELCDFAAVDSSHQHNCYWARRYLGLVKGSDGASSYVWTVEDINKANDWAEFWWQLHTSPENVITIHGESPSQTRSPRREEGVGSQQASSDHLLTSVATPSATIRGWRKGNFLDVHFALPAPESYSKPHSVTLAQDEVTPSSYKYIRNPHERAKDYARPSDMLHYATFVRPRFLAKVAGYNGRFMSVMIPRRKSEEPAKVERLPSIDNSLAVRITFSDVEDTLIWAYEHNLLRAGEVDARGQWCVVRRRAGNGRVVDRATGRGPVNRQVLD